MSNFAYLASPVSFVVQNVSSKNKAVRVFNVKLAVGQSYNLMAIPGIGEAEIMDSLLKGELKTKLANGDLVIVDNSTSLEFKDKVVEETLAASGWKEASGYTSTSDHAKLIAMFHTIDLKDATGVAAGFTDDGIQTFQNFAPWVGKAGIEAANAYFFSTIQGLHHTVVSIEDGEWNGTEKTYSVHAQVQYHRWDNSYSPLIDVYSTVRYEGDLIKLYQIYMDAAHIYV